MRPPVLAARATLIALLAAAAPAVVAAQRPTTEDRAEAAPRAVLLVVVRDADGVPLDGVRVRAGARREGRSAGDALAEGRTDADGRATLVLAAAPGAVLRIEATRIGHSAGRTTLRARPLPDSARATLVLPRLALATVQITATPTARDPRAVTQSTTTVGAAELDRSGGATLAGSLAGQPGVSVRTDGPGASAPIVRGLSGERLVVLHDGVRTGDLAATAPDHGVTIDPLAADRVEIVRGPAALVHGNNAVGGVVHVVSGDVPLERAERTRWRATGQAESGFPGVGAALELSAPLGAPGATGWTLRTRAGARGHGDQRLGAGAGLARLANTGLDARHAAVGLGWTGTQEAAGVAWRGYDFAYGMPVVSLGDAPVRLAGERRELLARAESRRTVGPFAGGRVDASAQRYEHRELVEGDVATRLGATSGMLQGVLRTRDAGPLRDGAVGVLALARRNPVDGTLALTPPTYGQSIGAFLFQELAPGGPLAALGARGVRVPVGVRWDRMVVGAERSDAFGPARRRVVSGVSGAVGVTAPLVRGWTMGANLSRAVRAPSAEELYAEAGHAGTGAFEIGDPTLGAEVARGADVVLRYGGAGRAGRRRATAQLAAYDTRVAGWIGLYPTARDTIAPDGAGGTKRLPLYQVQQRAARLTGAEASVELPLMQGVASGLGAASAHGLVLGLLADVVRGREADGGPLPFTPPARVGAHLRWEGAGAVPGAMPGAAGGARAALLREAGVRVRHALAVRRVAEGEAPTSAYTLVDLHAALRIPLAGRAPTLTVRVDNLTDALWRDAASRLKAFAPGMGRNVVVGWRAEW